ncbi:MAG: formate dehydrogenase accessory sulfurtransferase FdhD [Planctomycetia bacterium]|nr:formate dehydrogenase accessory sulfurtransferase FdhD [Planctomycetia bacterium]
MTESISSRKFRATRIDAEGRHEVEEAVACERVVAINLCGISVVRLACLPDALEDLAVGFLYSEGILLEPGQLKGVSVNSAGSEVTVDADIDPARLEGIHERMLLTSGCGKGASLDNLEELMDCDRKFDLSVSITAGRAMELMHDFQKRSELFKTTGGVHAAAMVDDVGIFAFAEDIGRHNAVDKIIGRAVRDGRRLLDKIVLTTGRLTFDIAAKALRTGIPIIISRSAPTDRAIELAAVGHIALVGFARGRRMNVYSAQFRIKG